VESFKKTCQIVHHCLTVYSHKADIPHIMYDFRKYGRMKQLHELSECLSKKYLPAFYFDFHQTHCLHIETKTAEKKHEKGEGYRLQNRCSPILDQNYSMTISCRYRCEQQRHIS
jgi:hypothetical protein